MKAPPRRVGAVFAAAEVPFDYQDFIHDAYSGTAAFHFRSEQDMAVRIRQTVYDPEAGTYEAPLWPQGGDIKKELILHETAPFVRV